MGGMGSGGWGGRDCGGCSRRSQRLGTERPRNPLPCPVLAQPELRCPWEMKMTADTLRGVLRPTRVQLPLPSLPIQLELLGPRRVWARAPNPGNPASSPEAFSAESPEGLWTAKPRGGGEGDVPPRSQGRGSPGRATQLSAPSGKLLRQLRDPKLKQVVSTRLEGVRP